MQNSPLESSCVVVALIENYSTSKHLKASPEKSQILSCDTVVANGQYGQGTKFNSEILKSDVGLFIELQQLKSFQVGILDVKSVLLYGCETWLVTSEIRRKIQAFVNQCLRYILRIWWPNIISNKDLWRVRDQEDINLEIRK